MPDSTPGHELTASVIFWLAVMGPRYKFK
jgi:hypothetical protein